MDKLKLAHDWAMQSIDTGYVCETETLVSEAWQYADAMQAEAEKREDKTRPEVLKEEWQPDWSQAPEWAVAFTVDTHGDSMWWSEQPTRTSLSWFVDDHVVWRCDSAPSFDYKGDWRESLRKRPNGF